MFLFTIFVKQFEIKCFWILLDLELFLALYFRKHENIPWLSLKDNSIYLRLLGKLGDSRKKELKIWNNMKFHGIMSIF